MYTIIQIILLFWLVRKIVKYIKNRKNPNDKTHYGGYYTMDEINMTCYEE